MIIKCPNSIEVNSIKNKWKVFLAGPIQGAPEWQFEMPEYDNVVWFSPRRPSTLDKSTFNYNEQVEWETKALLSSNVVLFWIPKQLETVEGRSYAQTTRYELGEYIARGKKVIIGVYDEFPGRRYLEYKAANYSNVLGIYNNLNDCLDCLQNYINSDMPNVWFTSDTHFSSERTLELSKRPFGSIKEMDWTMISNWNNVVKPNDIVFHLGDFGETWPIPYLSGLIQLVYGNYERDGKTDIEPSLFDKVNEKPIKITHRETKTPLVLCHEPLTGKKWAIKNGGFCLFGHIHGRQKVKEFGIDVGVDGNNFTPININDIMFLINAIKKGYYDDEVWS